MSSYNYYSHELAIIANTPNPRLAWKRYLKTLIDKYGIDTIAGCLENSYVGMEHIQEDDIKRHLESVSKEQARRCPDYVGPTYGCCSLCIKDGGCRYTSCGGYLDNCKRTR